MNLSIIGMFKLRLRSELFYDCDLKLLSLNVAVGWLVRTQYEIQWYSKVVNY